MIVTTTGSAVSRMAKVAQAALATAGGKYIAQSIRVDNLAELATFAGNAEVQIDLDDYIALTRLP